MAKVVDRCAEKGPESIGEMAQQFGTESRWHNNPVLTWVIKNPGVWCMMIQTLNNSHPTKFTVMKFTCRKIASKRTSSMAIICPCISCWDEQTVQPSRNLTTANQLKPGRSASAKPSISEMNFTAPAKNTKFAWLFMKRCALPLLATTKSC